MRAEIRKQLGSDFRFDFLPTEDLSARTMSFVPNNIRRTSKPRDRYVFLVHGFNVRGWKAEQGFSRFRETAHKSSAEFSRDMLTMVWPGKAIYWKAIPLARQAAGLLANHLASLNGSRSENCDIVLIGHSLGCRLILEALDRLTHDRRFWEHKRVSVFLMAAAVPVHLMEPGKRLRDAAEKAGMRVIFYSWDDWILVRTFPWGQTIAARQDPDEGFFPQAVGATGLPAGAWSDFKRTCYGHGGYWKSKRLPHEIAQKLGLVKSRSLPDRKMPARIIGGFDSDC